MSNVKEISKSFINSVDPFNYYKNNFWGMNYLMHRKNNLKLNITQKEILQSLHKSSEVTIVAPRQAGVSSTFALYVSWNLLYKEKNIGVIVNNKAEGTSFLNKVRDTLVQSDDYNSTKLVIDKRNRIDYRFSNVKIYNHPIEFRGTAPDILIFENAAFYDNLEDFLMCALPTINSIKDKQIIMSSTMETENICEGHFKKWFLAQRRKSNFFKKNLLLEKADDSNVIYNENCEVLNFLR